MGKQASRELHVKANHLLRLFPTKFSTDFTANKKALKELGLPFSKMSVNIIAGQIVRLVQHQTERARVI